MTVTNTIVAALIQRQNCLIISNTVGELSSWCLRKLLTVCLYANLHWLQT